MIPSEARRLIGRTIVAIDLGGSWETDEHGGQRQHMHMHPSITLDDGTELRFYVEEHPTGDGALYGVHIIKKARRAKP